MCVFVIFVWKLKYIKCMEKTKRFLSTPHPTCVKMCKTKMLSMKNKMSSKTQKYSFEFTFLKIDYYI